MMVILILSFYLFLFKKVGGCVKLNSILIGFIILHADITQANEWELIWSDEFNYSGFPDKTKWDYEEGFVRNKELQYYTRQRTENIRVENGVLVIEARKENLENSRYKRGSLKWQEKRETANYSSASINTLGKMDFQYGRIAIRAKLPKGNGMWPAIWLMGVNRGTVGWPRCGEIDIMEYAGKTPNFIYASNHFADPENNDVDIHKSEKKGGG
jgi:beta-glucanase (GH16 family)